MILNEMGKKKANGCDRLFKERERPSTRLEALQLPENALYSFAASSVSLVCMATLRAAMAKSSPLEA
jgi:hypothetical protein